jgi:predicted HTH domain antitoxin
MTTVTLNVPDGFLDESGLDEKKLKAELACTLFAQRKIDLWPAAQLAGLTRVEMENELADRNIPIYYVDETYWADEKAALAAMRQQWPSS